MTTVEIMWINLQDEHDQGTAILPLPITIGRAEDNDLWLGGVDSGVSRYHAQMSQDEAGISLHDLNSTNGVYLDGEQIARHKLQENTVCTMGHYELRFNPTIFCTNELCQRQVSYHQLNCPWCGYFLADAYTQLAPWMAT